MAGEAISNKKYYWLFTVFFLIFGVLVALVTSMVNYNIQSKDIKRQIQNKFEAGRNTKREILHRFTTGADNQVLALANNQLTLAFIQSRTEVNQSNINDLFLAATQANEDYTQVRFLDSSGHERVRIDRQRGSSAPNVVPLEQLQDKGGRYYFKEASQLPSGRFWHSNLDLNMERGQIEKPLNPTFRVAAPIYVDNRFAGLVIINLRADHLLQTLKASPGLDVFIVDKTGDFILHPTPSKSWSHYFPERPNLASEFPDLADRIQSNLTFEDEEVISFSLDNQLKNKDEARMILVPQLEFITQLKRNNLIAASVIALIVIVASLLLSVVAALVPSRLQRRLNEAVSKINTYQSIVNKNVITSSTDSKGHIKTASDAFTRISGYSVDELVGQTHGLVRHPDTCQKTYVDMWSILVRGETWRGEFINQNKDGDSFWLSWVITTEFDETGAISGYTGVGTDISDKKEVEKLSITDQLTKLNNRRHLDALLAQEIDRFQRYQQPFGVILADIDHFKEVNDTFGHQTGDFVLKEFAEILSSTLRKVDTVGRWGGEEFLIVCPVTSVEDVKLLAEKLRLKVEAFDFTGAGSITSSFGAAEIQQADSVDNLIGRADKALYQAKESGRNCVVADHPT